MPKGQFVRTEEHKRHIAEALRGKPKSEEHKKVMSESRTGVPWNDPDGERRKALSEKLIRYHPSRGKTLTPEWKRKLSESHKGRSWRLAREHGIPHEEYAARTEAGEKWCWFHKGFAPGEEFPDKSRGLCSKCTSQANRQSDLKSLCGVDHAWYEAKLAEQGGVCALCGKVRISNKNNHMHVDHDHKTGAARGILCSRCNHVIERFEDTPDLAIKAMSYLLRYK